MNVDIEPSKHEHVRVITYNYTSIVNHFHATQCIFRESCVLGYQVKKSEA